MNCDINRFSLEVHKKVTKRGSEVQNHTQSREALSNKYDFSDARISCSVLLFTYVCVPDKVWVSIKGEERHLKKTDLFSSPRSGKTHPHNPPQNWKLCCPPRN